MIEKFEGLEEFEHLLLDEVGVVKYIRHTSRPGADEDLAIVLEDGREVRCTTKQIYCWNTDHRGRMKPSHAPRFRQFLKPGTPVTFRWNCDKTQPLAVMEWDTGLFGYVWKRYRFLDRNRTVLWEGRNLAQLRKEHPRRGGDRHREFQVLDGGAWVKTKDPR